jgi:hypothetical protein
MAEAQEGEVRADEHMCKYSAVLCIILPKFSLQAYLLKKYLGRACLSDVVSSLCKIPLVYTGPGGSLHKQAKNNIMHICANKCAPWSLHSRLRW